MWFLLLMGGVSVLVAGTLKGAGEAWPDAIGGGMLWGVFAAIGAMAVVGALRLFGG